MNGTDLLAEYRTRGSEEAFARLVRKYTDFIYSVARRHLTVAALVDEATQAVFMRLATSSSRFSHEGELMSWLHRTTIHVAVDLWRSEHRRQIREHQAADMQNTFTESIDPWPQIAPHLDEALNSLRHDDRQALLLRFFDKKPMREIGLALGISEDAAKMRIGRALQRLRLKLEAGSIACTSIALGELLAEHSVEAAPPSLPARLAKLPWPRFTPGLPWMLPAFLQFSKSRFVIGSGVAIAFVIATITLLGSHTASSPSLETSSIQPAPSLPKAPIGPPTKAFVKHSPLAAVPAEVAPLQPTRLILHVVDADTMHGLADAKVRAAHFFDGGQGEVLEKTTDDFGDVSIPAASHQPSYCVNLFVTVANYVPKSMQVRPEDTFADYTLKLNSALTVGGKVLDSRGEPVVGVKIRPDVLYRPNDEPVETVKSKPVDTPQGRVSYTFVKPPRESIDFQTTETITDAEGRWVLNCIPKHHPEIGFILTCNGFATSRPTISLQNDNLSELIFTLDSGFSVSGHVTDLDAKPIAGAQVKERRSGAPRQQSTHTDEDGFYILKGLTPYLYTPDSVAHLLGGPKQEPESFRRQHEPSIPLVVQAEGFAPQVQFAQLLHSSNTMNFSLDVGHNFHGRVHDSMNRPIANAVVQTDTSLQGEKDFDWVGHTDAEGRFEWTSAPAEAILFWFEAFGSQPIRGLSLAPSESGHDITLKPQ